MKKHAYLIMAFNEFHMLKKLLKELDDEHEEFTKYLAELNEMLEKILLNGSNTIWRMSL